MNKTLLLICIWFILIGLSFLVLVSGAPVEALKAIWAIGIVYFIFMWGYVQGWHKREWQWWRHNIAGIVLIVSMCGLGVVLYFAMGWLVQRFLSSLFTATGFILIAIGIVVRKFWPHRRGSIGIWLLSFSTSGWFALTFYGGLCLAIAIFCLCAGI
ncbi:MAG: hypothetical protein ACE5L6_04110 [Candidatus Bathyarchaeia archaeon]